MFYLLFRNVLMRCETKTKTIEPSRTVRCAVRVRPASQCSVAVAVVEWCAQCCDAHRCTVWPHRCSSSGRAWRSSSGAADLRAHVAPFPFRIRTNELAAVLPRAQCRWVRGCRGCSSAVQMCNDAEHDDDGPALTVPLSAICLGTAQFPPPTRPAPPCHRVARAPAARSCVDLVAPSAPHHVRIRIRIGLGPRCPASAARPQVEQQAQPRRCRCQGKESAHAVRQNNKNEQHRDQRQISCDGQSSGSVPSRCRATHSRRQDFECS